MMTTLFTPRKVYTPSKSTGLPNTTDPTKFLLKLIVLFLKKSFGDLNELRLNQLGRFDAIKSGLSSQIKSP